MGCFGLCIWGWCTGVSPIAAKVRTRCAPSATTLSSFGFWFWQDYGLHAAVQHIHLEHVRHTAPGTILRVPCFTFIPLTHTPKQDLPRPP